MKRTFIILIALALCTSIYGQKADAIYKNMVKAIDTNDVKSFNKLLPQIPDINYFVTDGDDSSGLTLLGHACRLNNTNLVEKLINAGADILVAESDGYLVFNALFVAVDSDAIDVVKYLLENGADPNCMNTEERLSVLSMACRRNNYDMAELLIENGALVDGLGDNEWTDYVFYPILDAVGSGNIHLVRLLIDNGCEIDVSDRQGDTPFNVAQRIDSPEILQLLLERQNTQPTSNKDDVLEFETSRLHIRIVEIEKGVYRYSSWQRGKPTSDKPLLIIENGKYIKNKGHGVYAFEYCDYSYSITADKGENDTYTGFLLIKKDGKDMLKENIIK